MTVKFYIKNKVYTVGNVVFPKGDSQLVWCKWHTPNTEQTVNIKVTATGGASVSNANISAKIADLDENPPPDPQADDRNDSFRAVSVPSNPQKTSASWSVWEAYWKSDWEWKADWKWENNKWIDRGEWEDNGDWEFQSKSYSV